jgi:23S rRNA (uracil1939-C5)-methyltransferase
MALDGDALGHVAGYAVLVAGAIPGELARVEVLSAGRKFGRGRLAEVLRASPHRVRPACRHFGPCGGCAWQHIAYAEQLRLKRDMLSSTLERALGRPVEVLPAAGIAGGGIGGDPAAPWGFRNKVHFVFAPGPGGRGLAMGHYRRASRDLVEVVECPVHAEDGNRIAFRARDLLRRRRVRAATEDAAAGVARHIVVRVAEQSRRTQATLVVTGQDPELARAAAAELAREAGAAALFLNRNDAPGPYLLGRTTRQVAGEERLREEVAGARFLISPRTFFQTSVRSGEKLVAAVLGAVLADSRPVLDLYSGCGLFALPLALRGQAVVAVEENPDAVADGIASRRENALGGGAVDFIRARAEDFLAPGPRAPFARGAVGAVILDPPREGCPEGVLRALASSWRPERLVYVSCNPRALAADLAIFARSGYEATRVEPVDMFPHTAHIEAVAVVERR